MITVRRRIRMGVLIERMEKQKEYSKKLGLEDISAFHAGMCPKKK